MSLPAPIAVVAAVFHNASLRRVLAAFIGFSLAEWATWIAILVYAFNRGGATETGIAALIQLAPSAVVAPLAASLGDRMRRERALLIAYLVQVAAMGTTGLLLLADAPAWLAYLGAAAAASSITLTRPIQAAILPSLSRTPSELTAANVAAGGIATASMLVGPALAGLALAVSGSATVFLGAALIELLSAVLVRGIHPIEAGQAPERPTAGWRSALPDALDGLGVLLRARQPRAVLSVLGAAAILWGALDVFIVVLALDVLALGESGVGFLNAAVGAGGLIGAILSITLVGRRGLAGPLGLAVLLWSVPLAAIGLLSSVPAAATMLALAGVGRVVMDVTATTLLQRATDPRMLARLFGILEGVHMASLAVGSIVAPLLIALTGERGAFLLAATAMLLAAATAWPTMRRLDDAAVARPREVALLRSIPMFAPLGAPAIERLATAMVPVHAHSGSAVVRQGEPGDHFFIITDGRVAISVDGERIREEGPGEAFGEIALLRNVPRTATVEALESTQLISLDRTTFLEAVTGQPASTAAAEATVARHLGAPGDAAQEDPADARA
ncbi:MAG TPA: MFS transporter [Candidatus Limnocylindria bacterium]